MQKDQTVLFVSEAQMLVTRGQVTKRQPKKVVVTVLRCYVFWDPYKQIQHTKNVLGGGKLNDKEQEYYSITGKPEYTVQLENKIYKLVTQDHPQCIAFVRRRAYTTRSLKNSVMLIDPKRRSIQFFFFETQKSALRFIKAVECCNQWIRYCRKCLSSNNKINLNWSFFLQKLTYNPSETIVISPMLFSDAQDDYQIQTEIKLLCELLDSLTQVSSIQLLFKIQESQGYSYLQKIVGGMEQFRNIKKLVLSGCHLNDGGLEILSGYSSQLSGLQELDLSRNQLTDLSFQLLTGALKLTAYFKTCNFAHNLFTLQLQQLFKDFLVCFHQQMILDFTHNAITDKSIESIEGSILCAYNPPIQRIDISHNRLSSYATWRLFNGDLENKSNHPNMSFVIYPVKFNSDIFKGNFSKWCSRQSPTQLAIRTQPGHQLANTDQPSKPKAIVINISKISISGKKTAARTSQIKNIQRLIDTLRTCIRDNNLEQIHEATREIKNLDYEFPLTSLKYVNEYLMSKMNEVLFIRNHKYISLVMAAASNLGLNLSMYNERLQKLEVRKTKFASRMYRLLNFQMHQTELVGELEETVKQALRLNIGGPAALTLFELKLEKDRLVSKLILDGYDPQNQLRQLRVRNYVKLYQYGVLSKEGIPLELKQQQAINSNLFEVYVQANYFALSTVSRGEYMNTQSMLVMDTSMPAKFLKFIRLARQRLLFITSQYSSDLDPLEFSISCQELKINVCRLIWLYNNIQSTRDYDAIPNFPRKVPITTQKHIKMSNKSKFMKIYPVYYCPVIRPEAKAFGIYQWKEPYTSHTDPLATKQIQRIHQYTSTMLKTLIEIKRDFPGKISRQVLNIINCVRESSYTQQVMQQLYIQIICFKGLENERAIQNLSQLIPILTSYMRPPISVEKELIAYLAEHNFDFDQKALSLNYNKGQLKCVDRDWIPTEKMVQCVIKNNGRVIVPISALDMTFTIQIEESATVEQLFTRILNHESMGRFTDKALFWIYKYNKHTNQESIIMLVDYVGQIMSCYDEENDLLTIRRRIFQPYYMVCYNRYSDSVLTSIYYEIKHFYLRGLAYKVCFTHQVSLAKMIAMVDIFDVKSQDYNERVKAYMKTLGNKKQTLQGLFPKPSLKKRRDNMDSGHTMDVVVELLQFLKSLLDNEDSSLTSPRANKRRFLDIFRDYEFFCSTNYQVTMDQPSQSTLVSINSQYIYEDTTQVIVFYQEITSIIPKERHVQLCGYRRRNGIYFAMRFGTKSHRQSVSMVMDILSYCVLRLQISNKFLYFQRQLHQQLMVENKLALSMFDSTKTSEEIVEDLSAGNPEQTEQIKGIVNTVRSILEELEGMELIAFKQKDIIHHQKSRFCKQEVQRQAFSHRPRKIHEEDNSNLGIQQGDTQYQKQGEVLQAIDQLFKAEDTTMMRTKRSQNPDTTGRNWETTNTKREEYNKEDDYMEELD